jgi:hypothetical protein
MSGSYTQKRISNNTNSCCRVLVAIAWCAHYPFQGIGHVSCNYIFNAHRKHTDCITANPASNQLIIGQYSQWFSSAHSFPIRYASCYGDGNRALRVNLAQNFRYILINFLIVWILLQASIQILDLACSYLPFVLLCHRRSRCCHPTLYNLAWERYVCQLAN